MNGVLSMLSSRVLSHGDNSKKLIRAELSEERLLSPPQIDRMGLSEVKLCFEQVAKSQPRKLIYVIKKTHHRFTLEKPKETPNPVREAQSWNPAEHLEHEVLERWPQRVPRLCVCATQGGPRI